MAIVFLFSLIAVPIVEIAVLIEAGGRIGVWPTIGAVVLTAAIGMALLRHQGLATLFRAQENLVRGVLPVEEMFDGLCLLGAGALLLIPGFVTDAAGFLLFLPPLRRGLRGFLARRLGAGSGATVSGATVIDGEFHEIVDDDDDSRPPPALPG